MIELKVRALKTILYSGKLGTQIYEEGTEFEMDAVSYNVRKARGEVEAVGVTEDEIISVNEGLPPLDEPPTRKKK